MKRPTFTDLTMPLREGIAAHSSHGRSVIELSPVMRHADFAGKGRHNTYDSSLVSFEVSQWLIGDQAGTHMDAPWHADAQSMITIDQVPLHQAYGPAVWIDCQPEAADGGISVETLERGLDKAAVSLRPGEIVLLRTGASDAATVDPVGYAGRLTGLQKTAAEWLRAAGAKLIGIDCVSVECVATAATADVHTNFLKPAALGLDPEDTIAIVENLVGIDRIPAHRFAFVAFPLPLRGAAGSPVRAVAVTDDVEAQR